MQQKGEVMSFQDGLTAPLSLDSILLRPQKNSIIHQTCYLFNYKTGQQMVSFYFPN